MVKNLVLKSQCPRSKKDKSWWANAKWRVLWKFSLHFVKIDWHKTICIDVLYYKKMWKEGVRGCLINLKMKPNTVGMIFGQDQIWSVLNISLISFWGEKVLCIGYSAIISGMEFVSYLQSSKPSLLKVDVEEQNSSFTTSPGQKDCLEPLVPKSSFSKCGLWNRRGVKVVFIYFDEGTEIRACHRAGILMTRVKKP